MEKFGTLGRLSEASAEEIAAIPTLGEVIGREVVQGLREKRPLINKLLRHMTLVEGKPGIKREGPLQGQKVCFTGTLTTMSRSEAQHQVEAAGGIAVNTVSQDLAYLVVGGEGGGGSKLPKAQALQKKGSPLQVLTETEFWKLLRVETKQSPQKFFR